MSENTIETKAHGAGHHRTAFCARVQLCRRSKMAKDRVARATDGAAPNKPAKLVGLKMVPIVAKADTTNPPMRNRTNTSGKILFLIRG